MPMANVINGGAHSTSAPIDFQEFMIVPVGVAHFFARPLQAITEIFHALKSSVEEKGLSTTVGDESGFAPKLESTENAIEAILQAIKDAGYKPGKDVSLALDVAASDSYDSASGNDRLLRKAADENSKARNWWRFTWNWPESIQSSASKTVCAEKRLEDLETLTDKLGDKLQLVGDDLCHQRQVHKKGIDLGVQPIRFWSKSTRSARLTRDVGRRRVGAGQRLYNAVISHRSGETEDATIADIAVATNAGQIKTGSLSRTDRVAKYNQLLRIEQILGKNAVYGGKM